MNEALSDRLYIMKAIAIFSVVCAHVAGNVNTRMGYIMSNILENLGSIGVVLFLGISGCFFCKNIISNAKFIEIY